MTDLQALVSAAHSTAVEKGFWDDAPKFTDPAYGAYIGNKLMLIVGELAEAHECLRKGEWDVDIYAGKPEGLPVELADVAIRLFDLCGALNFSLGDEVDRKMSYNATRQRLHGKKF